MRPIMMFTLDPELEFEDYGELMEHITTVAYSEAKERGVTLPDRLKFMPNKTNTVVAVYEDNVVYGENLESIEGDIWFHEPLLN